MRKELIAALGSMAAGIQIAIDIWAIGGDIGSVFFWSLIATLMIFTVWYGKVTETKKPKRRKVQMYDLREIETPDWPMYEI